MRQTAKLELKRPRPQSVRIRYDLVQSPDIDGVVRIYLASFPHRVKQWFPRQGAAEQFYRDLFSLLGLSHGRTFFVARARGCPIGFLILTMPGAGLFRALWREGFFLRVAARAVTGRYGFAWRPFAHGLKSLLAGSPRQTGAAYAGLPHIYAVAVAAEFTGKGIGSALIERARSSCRGRFGGMWLCVERTNTGAQRLYERIGFRIVESDEIQHVMLREERP